MKNIFLVLVFIFNSISTYGQTRARDLGIPFKGNTGEHNAITDVKGVEVGYSTIRVKPAHLEIRIKSQTSRLK